MKREPSYIEQSTIDPNQYAFQYLASEPMALKRRLAAEQAVNADIYGDHNAYLANQQRLAAQNAWTAQQQAAGLATNANVEALKQEKAENMVKISQLKAELAQLQTSLGDEDSFSRELAANRARIGDLANSRAHQQDITNRFQWKWQAEQNEKSRNADKELQKRKEIQNLIGNIEDLDVMLSGAQVDSKTRDALMVKRNRLERELKALGKEYVGVTAVGQSNNGAKTIAQLKEDYSTMVAKGYKKKYPSKAEIAKFKSEIDKLPDSNEKNDLLAKYHALKSGEDVKAAEAKYREKVKKAVEKAKQLYNYNNGMLPANSDHTYEVDGIKIKIEPHDGQYVYIVGNQKF